MLVSIAREQKEDRFRAKLHQVAGGPAIFITARKSGSMSRAKVEVESLFGTLAWSEPGPAWEPYTRLVAEVNL